jgi:hypothetical protein
MQRVLISFHATDILALAHWHLRPSLVAEEDGYR